MCLCPLNNERDLNSDAQQIKRLIQESETFPIVFQCVINETRFTLAFLLMELCLSCFALSG
jgi:hypothetical protein